MTKDTKPLFTTDDFNLTGYYKDIEGTFLSVKTTSEIFSNLVRDGYFGVIQESVGREHDDEDRAEILERTGADSVSYYLKTEGDRIEDFIGPNPMEMTLEFDLAYSNHDKSCPRDLNREHVIQGLTDAANTIVPRAQKRVLKTLEKRYGIKLPKAKR